MALTFENPTLKKNKRIGSFKSISSASELRAYLESTQRDKEFIYHYTTIDRFIKILKSGHFVFSSMGNTNDLVEFDRIKSHQKNYFVGSFSRESDEVIAMWGMYAIPWELGIRIAIPMKVFRKWINNTDTVYDVDDRFLISKTGKKISHNQKSIHTVCYANENNTKLSWSNVQLYTKNHPELVNWRSNDILAGFIKEKAWMYEAEVRSVIKMDETFHAYGVALPLSEELLESIEITLSPKFDIKNYRGFLESFSNIRNSKYDGMVVPRTICNSCEHKYSLKELMG